MNLVFKPTAQEAIKLLAKYIADEILMPETAMKYIDKLIVFANGIAITPAAHTFCKYPPWKIKKLQCATFDKKWVFAYKIVNKNVVVFYIVNSKLLKY
jgi:hypothetical protein